MEELKQRVHADRLASFVLPFIVAAVHALTVIAILAAAKREEAIERAAAAERTA